MQDNGEDSTKENCRTSRKWGFLSSKQHGFREGQSAVTNLLEFYDKVSEILHERDR